MKSFIEKYKTLFGIIGSILIMLDSLLILLIGTRNLRVEFHFILHMVIPTTIAKLCTIIWCYHYYKTKDYDKGINTFSRNLLYLTIINIVITFLDYEMYLFFLVQSVTSLFLTILMCLLVNQRRFAIRSKKHAARLYIVNIFLYLCIAAIAVALTSSFEDKYVFLLVFTMITQIFMVIAMTAVSIVEKKFKEALLEGKEDAQAAN